MRLNSSVAVLFFTILAAGTSRADFKYTQQSKITGGTLVGVTKTLGVFSRSARQATEPQLSTTMVRGNRMRTEHPGGTVEIIDLEGRRFIHIDTTKNSYSIQTFDQFKQQIEQAREKMKEQQAKSAAKNDNAKNIAMVPKVDVQSTGQTPTIMDVSAKEMKMRLDMLFQSTDPKTEADLEKSNASFWMTGDSWYGSIPGYEEVRQFYIKMAKELNWLPGSMGMANPQMSQAAEEFRKNSLKMDGMPLVQYSSFGMAGNAQRSQPGDNQSAGQSQPQQQTSSASNDSTPTNPKDAITKSLGGLFKKKQQQQQQTETANASSAPPQPPSPPGSMMDVTTQVTSDSKDSLDDSLFDVPSGYTQVQADAGVK
jgi:hypothetical protein